MARPRSKHFVPYDIAVAIVRENGIRSRADYWRYRDGGHHYLPRVPNRHYVEWVSWNEFLGTSNSFEKTTRRRVEEKKVWREYWDAVRWAQAQAKYYVLTSKDAWLEWYDEYDVPSDIPKRPDQVYPYGEFSWAVWLGKDIMSAAQVAENSEVIVGLHGVVDQPMNVIKLIVWKQGYYKMVSQIEERPDVELPFKMYIIENETDFKTALAYVNGMGSKQYDDSYIIHNMNQLVYELDSSLLIYRPPSGIHRQV